MEQFTKKQLFVKVWQYALCFFIICFLVMKHGNCTTINCRLGQNH